MKRIRENEELNINLDMAKCLMFFSHGGLNQTKPQIPSPNNNMFECKTCNRKFPSFQALGGHRASHRVKPRLTGMDPEDSIKDGSKLKPKMHECTVCGLEFAIGQALGGHMRRHNKLAKMNNNEGFSSANHQVAEKFPVLRRSSSTRIMCLDLNLTPLENDLKLLFGNMAPKVDAFVS